MGEIIRVVQPRGVIHVLRIALPALSGEEKGTLAAASTTKDLEALESATPSRDPSDEPRSAPVLIDRLL
jgi:hypothetical protein